MKKALSLFTALVASILLLVAVAIPAGAVAPWNVTGEYEITFELTGDPTPFTHHASLNQSGSVVTGSGGYPATGGDTYHWNVTSGSQTADSLSLSVLYDLGAVGTVMNMTGTIAPDGTVTGTWTDDFGGPRSGTWSITKGVSVPSIHTPANGSSVTQAAFVKVDWTDSIGSNPPFEYQYEAFSDAGYTSSIYLSGWLSASEIPTPGTPLGDYYLRVKARNLVLTESAWSNGAGNEYKVTVTTNATPSPTPTATPNPIPEECNQNITYNVINGTSAGETINGTAGNDLIFGMGGDDKINGKSGNDCLVGDEGMDKIDGGSGNDVILGGSEDDDLSGSSGNDKLYGSSGLDKADGGSGNDYISGGENDDNLLGSSGNDELVGDAGTSDSAKGGSGTDTCNSEVESSCEL